MTRALISCIVPVHNGERYLAATLESILAQTYEPIEVIVVDDGSTDGTPDLVSRYGARLSYLRQPNGGQVSARNRGLDVARGEYVAFLDADDLWHGEKLARQIARFAARPELAGSVTLIESFWSPDLRPEDRWFRDDKRPMIAPGYSPVTLLTRRDAFTRFGRWDAGRAHTASGEWFIRAQSSGAVLELLPEVLVRRRLHATNRSRMHSRQSGDEYLRLVKAQIDRRRKGQPQAPAGD